MKRERMRITLLINLSINIIGRVHRVHKLYETVSIWIELLEVRALCLIVQKILVWLQRLFRETDFMTLPEIERSHWGAWFFDESLFSSFYININIHRFYWSSQTYFYLDQIYPSNHFSWMKKKCFSYLYRTECVRIVSCETIVRNILRYNIIYWFIYWFSIVLPSL